MASVQHVNDPLDPFHHFIRPVDVQVLKPLSKAIRLRLEPHEKIDSRARGKHEFTVPRPGDHECVEGLLVGTLNGKGKNRLSEIEGLGDGIVTAVCNQVAAGCKVLEKGLFGWPFEDKIAGAVVPAETVDDHSGSQLLEDRDQPPECG